jgi:hypothetical protein
MMKRSLKTEVEISLCLRRQGTITTDKWTGHVMLNDNAICGEPVFEPTPISWDDFVAKTCMKCRGLLERGSFGPDR